MNFLCDYFNTVDPTTIMIGLALVGSLRTHIKLNEKLTLPKILLYVIIALLAFIPYINVVVLALFIMGIMWVSIN